MGDTGCRGVDGPVPRPLWMMGTMIAPCAGASRQRHRGHAGRCAGMSARSPHLPPRRIPVGPRARGQGGTARSRSASRPATRGPTVGSVVRAVVQPFLAASWRQRAGRRGHRARRRLDRRHGRPGQRRRGTGGGRPGAARAARVRPWPPPWPARPATSWSSSTPTWPTRPRPSSPACSGRSLVDDRSPSSRASTTGRCTATRPAAAG